MDLKYRDKRLYLSPPHLSGKEMLFVVDAFQSNWIAPLGPMVDAFEREFAEVTESGYAAALSSGTAAIHIALRLLGISSGDIVVCPSLTFIGSVSPILYLGAEPVFIDSETASWNMDPDLLREEIQRCAAQGTLPKAVLVVHIYGQSADMDPILETCTEYDIPVIEDAAESLGARYKNRTTGSMGRMGVFSFNGNKIITTSGGGMLVSDDETVIEKARFLASQAREPLPYYEHRELGYNYRLSNILAAIGRGQLTVLSDRIEKKRHVFQAYHRLLHAVPGVACMPEPEWSYGTRWLSCITIDPDITGVTREDVRKKLESYNIESRPLWKPMHMQPLLHQCRTIGGKVSDLLFRHGLCLPSGTAMDDDDIEFICSIVRDMCGNGQ